MSATAVARTRGINARRRRRLNVFRTVVLVLLGVFFLTPLFAMFEFTTRGDTPSSPRSLAAWGEIASAPNLISSIVTSLGLAVITSVAMIVLLVPTMIWVRLRLPRLFRVIEFLCLLPLTIPAIVLVVGLAPVYLWVTYFFGDSALTLSFAYVILVLPYTFRALDAGMSAIDVRTMSEAARSLGAGWTTVMFRIIPPNMRAALLNASLLSVALVLGEFTLANLLNFLNLQVEINQLGQANAPVSIAVALGSLLFAFALLVSLSFVDRPRGSSAPPDEGLIAPLAPVENATWGQQA
ncbi:MAG TPA: ABC transporter permease subunit [Candidatus Nanopelagicales bacterium]